MSGSLKIDFAAIKAANMRRRECPRHHFPTPPEGWKFGAKHICTHCGWEARLHEIGEYIQGYEAAGGDGRDIIADWQSRERGA